MRFVLALLQCFFKEMTVSAIVLIYNFECLIVCVYYKEEKYFL